MEIVLHIGSLFPCGEPVGFPAKHVKHACTLKCSSARLWGALPTSSPLLPPGTGTWDGRAPSCGAGHTPHGQGVLSWWGLAILPTFRDRLSKADVYKAILNSQSRFGNRSKDFSYRQPYAAGEGAFTGSCFNVIHPHCYPRWWGHKDGGWQRGFQANKWASEKLFYVEFLVIVLYTGY